MKQIVIYDVVCNACVQSVQSVCTNINTPSEFVGLGILELCEGGKTIRRVEIKNDNDNNARAT